VVSALFLDIRSAFQVVLEQLVHNMRKRGVQREYTDWIGTRCQDANTTLKFDGFELEAFPLSKGLDQGCPLSGLAFHFTTLTLLTSVFQAAGGHCPSWTTCILV